jgi:hypothetical protein
VWSSQANRLVLEEYWRTMDGSEHGPRYTMIYIVLYYTIGWIDGQAPGGAERARLMIMTTVTGRAPSAKLRAGQRSFDSGAKSAPSLRMTDKCHRGERPGTRDGMGYSQRQTSVLAPGADSPVLDGILTACVSLAILGTNPPHLQLNARGTNV